MYKLLKGRTNIFFKLILYFLSVELVVLLLINVTSTTITNNEVKAQFILTQNHILSQNREYIDSIIQVTNNYVNQLTSDKYFYDYLLNNIDDYPTYYHSVQQARKRLDTILLSNEMIEGIRIVVPEGVSLSSPAISKNNLYSIPSKIVENIKKQPFYKLAEANNDMHIFLPPGKDITNPSSDELVISNVKSLKFIFTENKIAVVIINIKPAVIQNILMKAQGEKQGYMFIVDEAGYIIAHPDQDKLGQNFKEKAYIQDILKDDSGQLVYRDDENKEKMFATYTSSNLTGWKYVTVVPERELTSTAAKIRKNLLMISIFCFGITIVAAFVISLSISRPIRQMMEAMKKIEEGDLNVKVEFESRDEFGILSKSFNHMVKKINSFIEEEYKYKIIINKIKVELLQMQINPHLLYNTLAMVADTAKKENKTEISEVAENLSALYKGILSKGKTISKFRQEVEMIKVYLELIRRVYKIDIDIILDIDEQVLDFYTIKLLLQPIVENAVVHGIKPKKCGTIMVSITKEEDSIRVLVSDDGVGMAEHEINDLNNVSIHKDSDKGYAVGNIIKRIKLFFGEEYGLCIDSRLGEGTNVVMKLPMISERDVNSKGMV